MDPKKTKLDGSSSPIPGEDLDPINKLRSLQWTHNINIPNTTKFCVFLNNKGTPRAQVDPI